MIRMAQKEDAENCWNIFAPVAETTATTFATEIPTVEDFERKITDTLEALPWIVFTEYEQVLGYAYASKHRSLGAYRWSVETSVYVASNAHRKGVGKSLYHALFKILKAQGYYNACAGITFPNAASFALHETVGFRYFCTYDSIGFKQGKWHDVQWWKAQIQEAYLVPPSEPKGLGEIDLGLVL